MTVIPTPRRQEQRDPLQILRQLGLNIKLQARQGEMVRPCLNTKKQTKGRISEMAQVQGLAAEFSSLSSIPRNHTVEGKGTSSKLSSDLHM